MAQSDQGLPQVTGRVRTASQEDVPFASVALLAWPDSTIAKATVADAEGRFELMPSKAGQFKILVKAVGYVPYLSSLVKLNVGGQVAPLNIQMREAAYQSSTVEVIGRKPIIRQEAGKTVVDVENSTMNVGLDALSVLRRMPGVVVSGEGAISLRGKAGVQIMIDGKLSYLSAQQLTVLLRSMSSAEIKEIELITQPDARFDAQGTAGIININTKRNKLEGINGEVHGYAGQGVYSKYNIGTSLNWAKNGYKVYGGYDYTDRGNLMDILNRRAYPYQQPDGSRVSELQDLTSYYAIRTRNHSMRLGTEIEKGNTSVRLEGNTRLSRELFEANSTSLFFDNSNQLQSRTQTDDYNPDRFTDLQLSAQVRQKLDTAGQNISLNAYYGQFLQNSEQTFKLWQVDGQDNFLRFQERYMTTTPDNKVFAIKTDYELPIGPSFKLSAGGKFAQVSVQTTNAFFNVMNGARQADADATNTFEYVEQIRAAYVQADYKKGKMSYQLGLRTEHWVADGKQVNTPISFSRNQLFFFPSGSLAWQQDDHTTLSAQYSRRLNRPSYGNLNPYLFQMDAYTFYAGNSNLTAEISNTLELTYSILDGAVAFSASYGQADNNLQGDTPFRFSDTSRRLFIAPINIPNYQNISLNVYGSLPLTKWWNADYYVGVYFNKYSGNILGGDFGNEAITPNAQLTNTFTLAKGLEFELGGNYNGLSAYGISRTQGFGQVSAGLKYKFWEDAASIRLAAQDIFWSEVYNTTIDSKWLTYTGKFRGDNRIVMLSFSYQFGQLKSRAPDKQSDTELQRMGGR